MNAVVLLSNKVRNSLGSMASRECIVRLPLHRYKLQYASTSSVLPEQKSNKAQEPRRSCHGVQL
jgi:hypothetical protein